VISNAAALQILAVSTDVLYNTMEDVFVTGICRAMTGISCTSVPGIPQYDEAVADCDLISSRVINVHHVTSVQEMTRLWKLVNNKTAFATQQDCGSKISMHVVITCMALLSIICCFYSCQRRPMLLPRQ